MRYMIRKVLAGVGLAIGGGLLSTPMQAQIHEVSRTPLANVTQLTFGHLCGDRFVVRNDGPSAIDLQYGLAGGTEHADLKIGGRESVELESTGRQAVERRTIRPARRPRTISGAAAVVRPRPIWPSRPSRTRPITAWLFPGPAGVATTRPGR